MECRNGRGFSLLSAQPCMETISTTGANAAANVCQSMPRAPPAVPEVVREGDGGAPLCGQCLQAPVQVRQVIGVQDLTVQVPVEHSAVSTGVHVDLETREDHEPAFLVGLPQTRQDPVPALPQLRKAGMMEIQDVLDTRIGSRHVGPVRVPRDGAEVQLLTGVGQRLV